MELAANLLKKLNLIPAPLVDTQSQLVRARAILEANRLGVFTALADTSSGLNSEELADRLDLSPEGVALLLRALAVFGYLKRRNGYYRNSHRVKRWILDPERGIANLLNLQIYTWVRLETLGENLKTGRPTMDYHQQLATTPSEVQKVYTLAMREVAKILLPEFLKRARLPRRAKRLLDIGGAHGEYARALARRRRGLQATVFDLAGPIATARQILETEGNPEGINLQVGNALEDDFGSDWDAVLLINVVHVFGSDQNQNLFKRIYKRLNPGGVLFISDQFLGLGNKRDQITSLLSLNFFNLGGRCYSFAEMEGLLREAGFNRVKARLFPLWLASSLIEAWK